MRRARIGFFVLAMFFAGLDGSLADERPPPYDVGVAAGLHFVSGFSGLGRYADESADNAPRLLSPIFLGRLSRRLGRAFALEAEAGLSPTRTRDGDASLWVAAGRLHLLRDFSPRERGIILFAGAGLSFAAARSSDQAVVESDIDGSLHAVLGAKMPLGRQMLVRVDGRLQWSPAFGAYGDPSREDVPVPPELELTVGLAFPFGRYPPPPPRDTDGDRLADQDDACPTVVGTRENLGCPDRNSDADNVTDRLDACPALAEDVDGFEDQDGCPDPDDDADGIADAADRCPRKAETTNGFEDTDGCPDEVPPAVRKFTGAIEGIVFRIDSAEILPESFGRLDAAAQILSAYPELRVEISGHTDSLGARERNLALSASRAEAVKTYLTGKGIDVSRLRIAGRGPDRPKATNATEQGRAQNRRIEFRLLKPGE